MAVTVLLPTRLAFPSVYTRYIHGGIREIDSGREIANHPRDIAISRYYVREKKKTPLKIQTINSSPRIGDSGLTREIKIDRESNLIRRIRECNIFADDMSI